MKLLRVVIFGAAALLGATCAASSNSNGEDAIRGITDNDELVGRPSSGADFFHVAALIPCLSRIVSHLKRLDLKLG